MNDALLKMFSLAVAAGALMTTAPALARPGMHNLRLELNGAAMLPDQSERFDFGGGGGLAYGFAPIPYLEIQAGYRANFVRAIESVADQPGYGAFHGLGLALALHPAPDLDAGDLWLAAGGDVVFTGDVVRPGINVRLGFDFNIAAAFRMGPFVGFHHVFQTDEMEGGLGGGDASLLTFGLSIGLLGDDDDDGGTEGDSDGDGVLDGSDACPGAAEDLDDFEDDDGCPDADNDGDGVEDERDACPNAAAREGRDENGDGCTDAAGDRDGDGLDDSSDGCPDAAEDADSFQDEDGCPDPDNDGDSLPDTDDECPNDAETQNGFEDEDGCPDSAPEQEQITEIAARILFPRASARPTRAAMRVVREMASFMEEHPEITVVQLEGHASSTGNAEFNQDLSRRRAERVRQLLVGLGVDEGRLRVTAHGSSQSGDNPSQDRVVTFEIVSRAEN